MHLAVLGSSSSGNCTVVWNTTSSLLIDCGFAPGFINRGLRELNIPPLAAVLITHVHSDHVHPLALADLLRKNIPLMMPRRIARLLERRFRPMQFARERNLVREAPPTGVEVGGFEVTAFPVPHDAPGGCSGYAIRSGGGSAKRRLAIATDLGFVEEGLIDRFTDSDAIVIESNHDQEMLETSARPAWLKRRIREIGHLSNDQCSSFIVSVLESSIRPPHTVVLAHISQECNTSERAVETMRMHLRARGIAEPRILPAHPETTSEIVTV